MSDSGYESTSSAPEPFDKIVKKCCWCGECNALVSNKKYCENCARVMHKECSRCHKPFPDKKFFKFDNARCNACHQKYISEKRRREERRNKAEDVEAEMAEVEEDIFGGKQVKRKAGRPSKQPTLKRQKAYIPIIFGEFWSNELAAGFKKHLHKYWESGELRQPTIIVQSRKAEAPKIKIPRCH